MTGHGEKLSRKRESAIAALLTEPTIERAAARAEISTRTLKNWLALPDFQKAYQAARMRAFDHALARLQQSAGAAVDALGDLLMAGNDAIRLGAARSILELGVRLKESLEVEARLAALEEAARQQQQRF